MSLVRQHGLMRPVTDLVLDKVLDDAARWISLGVRVPVAVNLFAPFLRDTRLPETLFRAMDRRGLPAELLTVEITEDLVLSEVALVTTVLRRLRGHGIRVAIDDFGSGYSALSYLRDLPIDEVKMDRHFIASVATNTRAAAVVRAVIELTQNLGITVVAEGGIEDAETADWLRRHGCDIGQGYHFGRPMDPPDQIPPAGRRQRPTGHLRPRGARRDVRRSLRVDIRCGQPGHDRLHESLEMLGAGGGSVAGGEAGEHSGDERHERGGLGLEHGFV